MEHLNKSVMIVYEDKKVLIMYDLKFVVNFDVISMVKDFQRVSIAISTRKSVVFTTKEFFDSYTFFCFKV